MNGDQTQYTGMGSLAWWRHQVRHKVVLIYAMRNENTGHVKIGRTSNVVNRLVRVKRDAGAPVSIVAVRIGEPWRERYLQAKCMGSHVTGEWFRPSPAVDAAIEELQTGWRGRARRFTRVRGVKGYQILAEGKVETMRQKLQAAKDRGVTAHEAYRVRADSTAIAAADKGWDGPAFATTMLELFDDVAAVWGDKSATAAAESYHERLVS